MRCLTDNEAADLVSGFLDMETAAAANAHAACCPACTKRIGRFSDIIDHLRADATEFDDKSFGAEIMTLIDLGRAEEHRLPQTKWSISWKTGVVAAAAAVVLISITALQLSGDRKDNVPAANWHSPENAHRFASRGAADATDQWVSLTMFARRDQNDRAMFYPVDETIFTDTAVAFAYEDHSASPFSYLMVFAVDSNGTVFWYYPARDPGGAQMSIATAGGREKTPLPDEVTHELTPGPIRFFGIFSRVPLQAEHVEGIVKRQLAATRDLSTLTRMDIEETGQWTRQLAVREKASE